LTFLFKCYWYDTNREIRLNPHHGFVKVNKKIRLRNINNVFVFAKQCQQVYYNYTPSFRNDHNKNNRLFIMKTKPMSHIQVVHDGNEKVTRGEDIFQLDELVDLY
jgi:hypothetical protein